MGASSQSLDEVVNKGEIEKGKPPYPAKTIDEQREDTRRRLAELLVYSYIGTIVLTLLLVAGDRFAFYWYGKSPPTNDQSKDLITLIWTTQTTLVGTALGFYFGGKTT
jgi:hypothetical protein